MPTTIQTITVCTLATAWEPTTFNPIITSSRTAAKTFVQISDASSPMKSDEA